VSHGGQQHACASGGAPAVSVRRLSSSMGVHDDWKSALVIILADWHAGSANT
jgi:hypothetical protein